MTHPSLAYESSQVLFDNQRLEFLGDAVIQLSITSHLYKVAPQYNEGIMTQMRSRLVSKKALSTKARNINLGEYLLMGKGESASGGRNRDSSLCDAFESLIGAIYLDGGMDAADEIVMKLMKDEISTIILDPGVKNPKGKLQETLQSLLPESPKYIIVSEEGAPHLRQFTCVVEWLGEKLGSGQGSSKKESEIEAAKVAIEGKTWEQESVQIQIQKMQLPTS